MNPQKIIRNVLLLAEILLIGIWIYRMAVTGIHGTDQSLTILVTMFTLAFMYQITGILVANEPTRQVIVYAERKVRHIFWIIFSLIYFSLSVACVGLLFHTLNWQGYEIMMQVGTAGGIFLLLPVLLIRNGVPQRFTLMTSLRVALFCGLSAYILLS